MLRTPPRDRPWRSFDNRLTIAGESSRSSESRRAAAARKSVLAKVDNLPRELAVCPSRVRVRGIGRDRPPDQRCLAKLHRIPDDRIEHVVVADDPQLVEHVLREVGAAVEERGEQPEDLETAVELQA